MNIDFSFSIQDWVAMFDQLLSVFENFFARIGMKLFADDEESTTKAK